MAVFQSEFYSVSLNRAVEFIAVIPNDVPPMMIGENPHYKRPTKTVYLLHGHGGKSTDWLYNGNLTLLAAQYNVNFILPSGENWFYLDSQASDRKYASFLGEELVNYVRRTFGLSDKAEDTMIGGLSMGGFGALHTGLLYPETFSKVIALSSALIIYDIKGMEASVHNGMANEEYYSMVFGDLSNVDTTINNPETLVNRNIEEGKKNPEIFMAIGTEDFLYEQNQIFRRFLESKNIEFEYKEGPGVHDFNFWNKYIVEGLEWALSE